MSKFIRFTVSLLVFLLGAFVSLSSVDASTEVSQTDVSQTGVPNPNWSVSLPNTIEQPAPGIVPFRAETILSAPVPEISVQKENSYPFIKPRSLQSDTATVSEDTPDFQLRSLSDTYQNQNQNQQAQSQRRQQTTPTAPQKSLEIFWEELGQRNPKERNPKNELPQQSPLQKNSVQKKALPKNSVAKPSVPLPTFSGEELPPLLLEQHDLYVNSNENINVSPQKDAQSLNSIDDPRIRQVLYEGIQLEQKQLWSDAMRVYEKALKQYADHPKVLERFRYCRFHYEITKRYRDASFAHLINDVPLGEILKVYSDILTRIKSNHVDMPEWKTLFQYGLDNLEIALADPGFLKSNNIQASPEVLEKLRRKVHETADPWSFRHIQDMKNGVLCVAEMIQTEIGVKPSVVLMEFICGASCGLDPYTSFLTRRLLDDFYSMIEGSFVGIGVELDSSDPTADVLTVLKVHPRSPAMRAGLKDGDCIIAVNGTSTTGLGTDRAADLLQGTNGSEVVLKIRSPEGHVREMRIVRSKVDVASVEDVHMLNAELGYIRLNCFQASTTQEMVNALNSLQKQRMKALVLDLRNNPGGLLPVAVEVANLFLENGIIVRTQNRDSQAETVWRANVEGTWRMPLFVLIDEESASASEIFAGAIRDHKRGLLIGRQSYGKGTVQIIYRLSGSDPRSTPIAGLKLTVERFYSPNGSSYCNVGVVPDIFAPDEFEEKVLVGKPDMMSQALKQSPVQSPTKSAAPIAKRKRITSDPNDPFIAEAVSAYTRTSETKLQRLSQRP